MKKSILIQIILLFLLSACGGGAQSKIDQIKEQSKIKPSDPFEQWESNPGVGPIDAFDLPTEIDGSLAQQGMEIYDAKCTACHKIQKKFIGPSPRGILEKRTPAWVMNMILNPDGMVKDDPMARQLLIDFNGSPMANQNLTEEEARAVLEYFRTL